MHSDLSQTQTFLWICFCQCTRKIPVDFISSQHGLKSPKLKAAIDAHWRTKECTCRSLGVIDLNYLCLGLENLVKLTRLKFCGSIPPSYNQPKRCSYRMRQTSTSLAKLSELCRFELQHCFFLTLIDFSQWPSLQHLNLDSCRGSVVSTLPKCLRLRVMIICLQSSNLRHEMYCNSVCYTDCKENRHQYCVICFYSIAPIALYCFSHQSKCLRFQFPAEDEPILDQYTRSCCTCCKMLLTDDLVSCD